MTAGSGLIDPVRLIEAASFNRQLRLKFHDERSAVKKRAIKNGAGLVTAPSNKTDVQPVRPTSLTSIALRVQDGAGLGSFTTGLAVALERDNIAVADPMVT